MLNISMVRYYVRINQNLIDRWAKACILPFPKKGKLGLAKNYRGITLTYIIAKIYNAFLRNRIEPKIENTIRRNQSDFRRNRSTTPEFWLSIEFLKVYVQKPWNNMFICRFTNAFDSVSVSVSLSVSLSLSLFDAFEERWRKYFSVIMMLYRNTKVKVHSPDGDTDYFSIIAGVLKGDTLAPYLFIICQDYVLRISIDKIEENGFTLTKERSRRNNYRRRLRRWYSASGKCIRPRRNPAT